jgi:hypothetical protein
MKHVSLIVGAMLLSHVVSAEEMKEHVATAHTPKMTDAQIIKQAKAAGPADLTKDASIAVLNDDMKTMREVKKGANNWVCVAMGTDSMCADKQWQSWAAAWMGHTKPQSPPGVGIAYMLAGDHGVSNTDPYAMEPKPDNNWVVSPSHIMVLTSDTKLLDSLPTDPSAGGPWVMWKGTDYAHIMVPTTAMPKQKAPAKAKAAAAGKE